MATYTNSILSNRSLTFRMHEIFVTLQNEIFVSDLNAFIECVGVGGVGMSRNTLSTSSSVIFYCNFRYVVSSIERQKIITNSKSYN